MRVRCWELRKQVAFDSLQLLEKVSLYNMTNVAKHRAHSGFGTNTHIAGRSLVRGLLAVVCAASLLEAGTSAQAVQRQALHGQVPPAVAHLQPLKRLAGTNRLELVIGLPLRNREALTSLLGQLYDPASSNYHRYLTPAEFARAVWSNTAGL